MAQVNYLAVLVAAVVFWVIGALWYTVLFGKAWMAESGKTPEELKEQASPLPHVVSIITDLLLCYVLAHFLVHLKVTEPVRGMYIGFWAWAGFVLTILAMNGAYEGKSVKMVAINSGYALVGLVVAGGILAAWQ